VYYVDGDTTLKYANGQHAPVFFNKVAAARGKGELPLHPSDDSFELDDVLIHKKKAKAQLNANSYNCELTRRESRAGENMQEALRARDAQQREAGRAH